MELSHHLHSLKAASEVQFAEYTRCAERFQSEWAALEQGAVQAGQLGAILRGHWDVVRRHTEELDACRVGCILGTAALVEGIGNLALTLRLAPPEFEAVEQLKFVEKWTVMMPLVVRGFAIQRDGQTFQALRELHSDRNALTHAKPKTSDGHQGKAPKYSVGQIKVVREKLRAWVGLPRLLIDGFRGVDDDLWNTLLLSCGYMEDDMPELPEMGDDMLAKLEDWGRGGSAAPVQG